MHFGSFRGLRASCLMGRGAAERRPKQPRLSGAGNMPGQQPAKPVTLLDIAEFAFRYGRDQDAISACTFTRVTSDATWRKRSWTRWAGSLP